MIADCRKCRLFRCEEVVFGEVAAMDSCSRVVKLLLLLERHRCLDRNCEAPAPVVLILVGFVGVSGGVGRDFGGASSD